MLDRRTFGQLLATSLALVPVGGVGLVYLGAALGLGLAFVAGAVRLRRDPTPAMAMRVFRFSIVYLALLFAAVCADTLLHVRL